MTAYIRTFPSFDASLRHSTFLRTGNLNEKKMMGLSLLLSHEIRDRFIFCRLF
jgi:hypothetical protein